MFTRRRFLKALAIGAVILVPLLLWMLLRKDAPVQDADLMPDIPTVKTEDNGYEALREIMESVDLSPQELDALYKLDTRTNWNKTLVVELLSKSEAPRKAWNEAVSKPVFILPRMDSPWNQDVLLRQLRSLALLKLVEAKFLAKQGCQPEAEEVAMGLVKMGLNSEMHADSTLRYAVGNAIEAMGLKELRDLSGEPDINNGKLLRISNELHGYEGHLAAITNSLKSEYQGFKGRCDDLTAANNRTSASFGERVSSLVTLRTDKTKILCAEQTRACLAQLNKHGIQMALPDRERMDSKWDYLKSMLSGNSAGRFLVDMSGTTNAKLILHKCRAHNEVNVTRMMLALRCYQNDHGQLPESLAELAPAYLKDIPVDDYDGKPFHYSCEKKVIYSVGENFKDDGGVEQDAKGDRLDDVYPIPF